MAYKETTQIHSFFFCRFDARGLVSLSSLDPSKIPRPAQDNLYYVGYSTVRIYNTVSISASLYNWVKYPGTIFEHFKEAYLGIYKYRVTSSYSVFLYVKRWTHQRFQWSIVSTTSSSQFLYVSWHYVKTRNPLLRHCLIYKRTLWWRSSVSRFKKKWRTLTAVIRTGRI